MLYDYKVIQNEHDGLITVGAVPTEAVDKAAEAAGMKYAYAVLDEKSFVWGALARSSNPTPLQTPETRQGRNKTKGTERAREETEEDTREEQGREG